MREKSYHAHTQRREKKSAWIRPKPPPRRRARSSSSSRLYYTPPTPIPPPFSTFFLISSSFLTHSFILSFLPAAVASQSPSEVYIEPLHPFQIQLSSFLSNVKMLTRPSFLLVLACAYVHVSSVPLGIPI